MDFKYQRNDRIKQWKRTIIAKTIAACLTLNYPMYYLKDPFYLM